eukprot:TRINITY_DN66239_c2_g1_i1.p1 TRINITY_DN66239_c2_g1~~TRINITY_DN66239_c2_g1_i1.p1  ORF type:complete len:437 (+),score=54.44 TRINITY_DN66239_c2_g1_i1:35-1345(+)
MRPRNRMFFLIIMAAVLFAGLQVLTLLRPRPRKPVNNEPATNNANTLLQQQAATNNANALLQQQAATNKPETEQSSTPDSAVSTTTSTKSDDASVSKSAARDEASHVEDKIRQGESPHQGEKLKPHTELEHPGEKNEATDGDGSEEASPEEIARCKVKQAKRYKGNKKEFKGDDPRARLLKQLLPKMPSPCGIKQPAAVVDLGANTGQDLQNWHQGFGKPAGCNNPIYFFEPNKVVIKTLKTKLSNKGTANDIAVQMGVSNVSGTAQFFTNNKADSKKNEHGSLSAVRWIGDDRAYNVTITTLDEFFSAGHQGGEIADIPLLKIDVEGREMSVFEGGINTLKKIRFILFECSDTMKDERGTGKNLHDLANFLHKHGFFTYKAGKDSMLKLWGDYWDDVYWADIYWSNCIAIPKGSVLNEWLKDGKLHPEGESYILC